MRWKSLKVNDVSVGENYINLGDIQASAGIKAEGSANQSGQPSSGPPEPPKASAPPPPPPPPPPPNNANAEFEAGSPPEKSQPIVINNVKAPLKVYNDIDFDQDVQPIDKKKEVEKKTSEAEMSTDGKKKKKNEEEQTGKTTQYYLVGVQNQNPESRSYIPGACLVRHFLHPVLRDGHLLDSGDIHSTSLVRHGVHGEHDHERWIDTIWTLLITDKWLSIETASGLSGELSSEFEGSGVESLLCWAAPIGVRLGDVDAEDALARLKWYD